MAGEKKKDEGQRPIIKKVKKVSGGGHHGGAWKVAYADFVTAMMAFFLLLWLLSSSSKATLQGLSEYFTPSQGIEKNNGSIGTNGGETPDKKGAMVGNHSNPAVVTGGTPSGTAPDTTEVSKSDTEKESNLFKEGASSIEQAFSQDAAMQQYQDNITIQQTPEGLKIDITDSDKFAMFEKGNATLTEHGHAILTKIASLIKKMPNFVSITGHTDASQGEAGRADYGNWELSSDRAQAARRFLLKSGIEPERPKKVVGMADRELFTPNEPRGPKNRRISILLLRGSHILIPDSAVPPDKNAKPQETPGSAPATAAATPEAAKPAETIKPAATAH